MVIPTLQFFGGGGIIKYVKFSLTVIIVLFCFIITGEIFQLHLQTFQQQYFYIDIENDDTDAVLSIVTSAAEKYGEHVFAVERNDIDVFHSVLTIYADESTQDFLLSEQDIKSGETDSFFSGSTEIIILPFEDIVNDSSVSRYYFTGSKDTVSSIRQTIYSQIATSYIHKEGYSIIEMLAYGIWIVSFLFILLLTWLDIQFSRKSDFLRISVGSSISNMILKKILIDVIFNVAVFVVAYIFLRDKIFLEYKQSFVCIALFTFLVLNSLLYTTLLNVDYKEVMYGANINIRLLANTYLLQAVVIILLVVSLSFNLTAIMESAEELAPYDTIEQMEGYVTLSLAPTSESLNNEDELVRLESDIYLEAYLQDKVLLATSTAGLDDDGNDNIIMLNEAALDIVVSDPEMFRNEAESDFVIYIPEERYSEMDSEDIEFAAYSASEFFGLEDYSYEVRTYSHADVVWFDLREEGSAVSYGSDVASDPVVVYCNLTKERIAQLLENNTLIEFGSTFSNVIFDIEDFSGFSESVKDRLADVQLVGVAELLEQYKSSLLRSVLLNCVLSGFLLVLSVLLILVIVRMEYLVHSKELALKRILGYSVMRRNAATLAINALAVFIAFVTGFILIEMYSLFDSWVLCIVCVMVLAVESVLLVINMAAAESHNTAHILKGGSL